MAIKLRLIFFLGVIILLSFCMLIPSEKNIFELLGVEYITVYADNNENHFNAVEPILNGNGYSFNCHIDEYKTLTDVQGISFQTNHSPEYILRVLNLKIQSFQTLSIDDKSLQLYYCYFKNLEKSVLIKNKKVNLQIAFDGNTCIVGLPILLGSY